MARMDLLLVVVALAFVNVVVAAPGLGMYPDQSQAPPGIDIEYMPARVTGGVNTVGNYGFLKSPIVSLPAVENDIPLLYNAQKGTNYAEQISLAPACSNATYYWITYVLPLVRGSTKVKYWKGTGPQPDDYSSSGHCKPKKYSVFPGTPGEYTSGWIYHCLIGPLDYNTVYSYAFKQQKPGTNYSFKTFPAPTTPTKLAMIGDVGQTWNSSSTYDNVLAAGADVVLFAGDLTYADFYGPPECVKFNGTDDGKTNYCGLGGMRWDSAMRLSEKVFSKIPVTYIPGNHELEAPAAWFPLGVNPEPFIPYKARVPGFLPDATWPADKYPAYAPFYYSYDVGYVHVIMLSTYYAFTRYTNQWVWIQADIARINRTVTPFVVVVYHNPIYHTNNVHYTEGEGFRAEYEVFFYKAKVDLIIGGHIHAYERSHPVFKNELDACGPVHVVLGDGGNIEGIYSPHMVTVKEHVKPVYSAFTDYYFGHAVLKVINATYAEYSWYRNIEGTKVGDFFSLTPKFLTPGC